MIQDMKHYFTDWYKNTALIQLHDKLHTLFT